MSGAELIRKERLRQISKESYDAIHDDSHDFCELIYAAKSYLEWVCEYSQDHDYTEGVSPADWPWEEQYWKPKSPIQDLVRAGALIAAEIDRLKRLEPPKGEGQS